MFFSLKNCLFASKKCYISADVHINISLTTNTQHQTDLSKLMQWMDTTSTCRFAQQHLLWVDHAKWLLVIPFWLEAFYTLLRAFHFTSLSSFSPIPQQQIMAAQSPQLGQRGAESNAMTDGSSNSSLDGPLEQCRHKVVHHDTADAATAPMTSVSNGSR